jgi:hypothetical protein
MNNINNAIFAKDKHGFLKQQEAIEFDYNEKYKKNQNTNLAMVGLRINFLSKYIPYEELQQFHAVDVGAGNNQFVTQTQTLFKRIVPYDLVGESITEDELYFRHWDLVVLSDVLEHYSDIDDFWRLSFTYALISYPEAPGEAITLSQWRHFKPNEHLYILNKEAFTRWVESHGCQVIAQDTPEDAIRTRWNPDYPNISTFLIHR